MSIWFKIFVDFITLKIMQKGLLISFLNKITGFLHPIWKQIIIGNWRVEWDTLMDILGVLGHIHRQCNKIIISLYVYLLVSYAWLPQFRLCLLVLEHRACQYTKKNTCEFTNRNIFQIKIYINDSVGAIIWKYLHKARSKTIRIIWQL